MKQEIHGNIEGVRRTLLEQMKALYQLEIDGDAFLPPELSQALAVFTTLMNREVAVYVTRDGEIVDVMIGTHQDVELQDYRLRRNSRRLSCVRCIHTHPSASGCLSDVDISALRAFRYDAMTAIAVRDGKPGLVQTAFLGEKVHGENQVLLLDPLRYDRIPQAQWMDRIAEADAAVLRGEDADEREKAERTVLMGIESEDSLEELSRLAETAGAQVVAAYVQKRDKPDGALFIGRGRAEELARQCQALEADTCIFDEELSGFQVRNLEEVLRVKVVDRTMLILDIFAQRASSREGKLQVELAQLNYQSTRLVGEGVALSRLAGGIGTRGPGESKLEINRRRIRERMTELRRDLAEMEKQRDIRRRSRQRSEVPVVALVGYTNAGKSTLMNRMLETYMRDGSRKVLEKDMLFATLDTTVRRIQAGPERVFLLSDTVGFIRKLTHSLVSAFRGTLEEAALADVLVIVSDGSSPELYAQRQVVEEVLAELGATEQPRIEVINKCDLGNAAPSLPGAVMISAQTGEGVDQLMDAIAAQLQRTHSPVKLLIPFSRYGLLSQVRPLGQVLEEKHTDSGTELTLLLSSADRDRLLSKFGPELFAGEK